MTPDVRTKLLISRTSGYYTIMLTTMFVLTATAAVIELGDGGYSAPLMCLVIAATAYGVLAGGSALDDMINLREDMDEATASTAYGKGVNARNLPMLKIISSALVGLIGLAELLAILI